MEQAVCNGGGFAEVDLLKISGAADHIGAGLDLPNGFSSEVNKNLSMGAASNSQAKILYGPDGYILEDVPHLSDYIPELPVCFLCPSFFTILW